MARKKKTGSSAVQSILNDRRSPKVLGLLLILLGVCLFIAYISYLFTWREDQSHMAQFSLLFPLTSDAQVENKLGRLGAYLSHLSFYSFVGISAFVLVAMSILAGLRMISTKFTYSYTKLFKYSFLFILLGSITLGFFLGHDGFPYGGAFGNFVSSWLVDFVGKIGTGFLLLFSLLILLVLLFDFNLESLFPNFKNPFKGLSWPGNERGKKENKAKQSRASKPINADVKHEPTRLAMEEESRSMDFKVDTPTTKKKYTPPKSSNPDDLLLDISITKEKDKAPDINPLERATERVEIVAGDYDPKLDLPNYQHPSIDLLESYGVSEIVVDKETIERNKDQIVETLGNYNIAISKIKATVGPTITLYEIVPAPGVRISKIKNLEDDIALSLAALGIRIIAPIPGKGTIGIEVPNKNLEIVSLRSILESPKFQNHKMELPIGLGTSINTGNFVADLAKMPHLLLAGATGQGKSVCINTILASLLYAKHPAELKFILVDPKKVELSIYDKIQNHFLAKLPEQEDPIVIDTQKVIYTLNALCIEMDNRYNLLKNAHVRNIREYNDKFIKRKLNPNNGHTFLPYIVLVIDEFADLIMTAGKEVELPLTRLAQLARAVGIHLVIATQRPTVNIITGTIKANFPVRIAFRVMAKIDSRTILDTGGADQLIGRGDMLLSMSGDVKRLQCAFIDTPEVERLIESIGAQQAYSDAFLLPEYIDESSGGQTSMLQEKDELFEDAARMVVIHQSGSTSLIQRRLKLGYNRAGRLMDQLEAAGIVGPNVGSKAREVYFADEIELQKFLDQMSS